MTDALHAGHTFVDALDAWRPSGRAAPPSRPRESDRRSALVVAALRLSARTGGARARAVDGIAATLRERQGAQREAHALATQARLSGFVIAAAPVGFALFVGGVDPAVVRFLLSSPIGLLCLVLGLALDGIGAWWMARLSRRVGGP